jgi:23S rRNA pseudouridine1911/1915/1917 synthase
MDRPTVISENSDFFVVEKPSGWITNDADTTTTQPVLQTFMRENFEYELKGDREYRDGIVHRLDKETSGIVIVAKTKDAFEKLQKEFKELRELAEAFTN